MTFIDVTISRPYSNNYGRTNWAYEPTMIALDTIKMIRVDYSIIRDDGELACMLVIGGEIYKLRESYQQVRELIEYAESRQVAGKSVPVPDYHYFADAIRSAAAQADRSISAGDHLG